MRVKTNRKGNINRCHYILEKMESEGVREITFQRALQITNNPRMAAMVVSVSSGATLHDDCHTWK